MKKIVSVVIVITLLMAMLSTCGNKAPEQSNTEGGNPSGVTESVPISPENEKMNTENIPQKSTDDHYSKDTKISDVVNDPVFGDYGRLIFPVNTGYYSGDTLGSLQLAWYNNIDPPTYACVGENDGTACKVCANGSTGG